MGGKEVSNNEPINMIKKCHLFCFFYKIVSIFKLTSVSAVNNKFLTFALPLQGTSYKLQISIKLSGKHDFFVKMCPFIKNCTLLSRFLFHICLLLV